MKDIIEIIQDYKDKKINDKTYIEIVFDEKHRFKYTFKELFTKHFMYNYLDFSKVFNIIKKGV